MNFNDAIKDKNRPISVSPSDWMNMLAQNLVENDNASNVIIASKEELKADENGVSVIDNGLDIIIDGIKKCYKGFELTSRANLEPGIRNVLKNVEDLFNTAIAPYTADVVKMMDDLEIEEKE